MLGDININIFAKSIDGAMMITNVENLSEDYVNVLKGSNQILGINIKNERTSDNIKENEFIFDITKIDSDTKVAITEDKAIFGLTYEDNTQYIETNLENGRLKSPILEKPDVSEFYNEDGSVNIPKALQPYMGGQTVINVK